MIIKAKSIIQIETNSFFQILVFNEKQIQLKKQKVVDKNCMEI